MLSQHNDIESTLIQCGFHSFVVCATWLVSFLLVSIKSGDLSRRMCMLFKSNTSNLGVVLLVL